MRRNSRPTIHVFDVFILVLVLCDGGSAQTIQQHYKNLIARGDSLASQQKFSDAEMAYRQALVLDKESLPALIGLGKMAYEKEEWEDAQGWFKKALDIEPDNQEALDFFASPKLQSLLQEGERLRTEREFGGAKEAFETALKIDKKSLEAQLGLARIGHDRGDWDDVKKWCKKILEKDNTNEQALHLLVTNPRPKALPVIEEGDRYLADGELENAEKKYKKALKTYKGSLNAFRGLGNIAYQKQDWGGVKDWYGKIADVLITDPEANYHLGIAYRETGKFKSLLLKKWDFGKSEDHFDRVLDGDPAYKDIFLQRALLERERENYLEAVRWGHKQIDAKPRMPEAHVGLWNLYRLFIRHGSTHDVMQWAQSFKSDWSAFGLAELARLQGNYADAKKLFDALIRSQESTLTDTPVYLSLVRLDVELNRIDEASDFFSKALEATDSDIAAAFMFEETKYILTDAEYEEYQGLSQPNEKKLFFERFWTSRNPVPASSINVRAATHYRRLVLSEVNFWFDGLRSWANNPDKVGYLKFPEVYGLNREFNDKGVIYIRHGKPDETAVTVGAISNESWHYFQRADRPEFIFHFLKDDLMQGNNWKLSAGLPTLEMIADRAGWDSKLDRLLMARSQIEANSIQYQIVDESRAYVKEAMSRDTHTWDEGTKELSMPYYIANFRGNHGKTRLELYYALFYPQLWSSTDTVAIWFEHGAGVYTKEWNEVDRFNARVMLTESQGDNGYNNIFLQRYEVALDPGEYILALSSMRSGSKLVGGDRTEIEVPEFNSSLLQMSDLELALEISPATNGGDFVRGDLRVVPNPTRVFRLASNVFLYFELYNLKLDGEGKSSFEIDNTMRRKKSKKEAISIKSEREGAEVTSNEYTSFDVSKLEEGEYELIVSVKDLNSGKSVEKSIDLTLVKEESR